MTIRTGDRNCVRTTRRPAARLCAAARVEVIRTDANEIMPRPYVRLDLRNLCGLFDRRDRRTAIGCERRARQGWRCKSAGPSGPGHGDVPLRPGVPPRTVRAREAGRRGRREAVARPPGPGGGGAGRTFR